MAFPGYILYSLDLLCVIFVIVVVFVWGCVGVLWVFCLLDGLATCVDQNKSPHKIYIQNRIIRYMVYKNGIWYIKKDHNFYIAWFRRLQT